MTPKTGSSAWDLMSPEIHCGICQAGLGKDGARMEAWQRVDIFCSSHVLISYFVVHPLGAASMT